jgi:plastocyanin
MAMARCKGGRAALIVLLLSSAAVALPSSAGAGAAIEGIVTLPERPPPPLPNPRYQTKTGAPVGPPDSPTAVVFVEAASPAERAAAPRVEIAQHHYQFAPGLLAIERGSKVAFPNLDDEYHSVFSYSKPKRFDLGRYRKDEQPAELVFDQPGLVKLFCEIHDHMRGWILVIDTPYFAKTTTGGHYRLDGVPAGHQVLKVWVDEDTLWERPVDLVDGGTLHADFP